MSDVTESVDVNVPVSTAYNQWTQFESFPQFMEGVESVTQTDDLHTHWVTSVGGAQREFDAEITEQHPDERIAWKSIGGDTSHAGVVTFHRLAADQTRVTVQLVWEPRGLVEKAGSLLNLDSHQVKADTKRFKKFIEEQGAPTGEYRGEQQAPGALGDASATAHAAAPEAAHATAPGTAQDAAPGAAHTPAQVGDIVEVLLGQHQEVKRRFAQLQTAPGEERAQLFAELADLLHTHETGEQQVVHPVTREDGTGGRQIAADRLEEEQQADQALADLKALGVDDPGFGPKLDAFHQAVLAHAAAEEEQEFPRLAELPPHRRQAMAEELRAVQNTPIPN